MSSKADRHYSFLLAHWGCRYYMYALQHMVHLSDGENSAPFEERKLDKGIFSKSFLLYFNSSLRLRWILVRKDVSIFWMDHVQYVWDANIYFQNLVKSCRFKKGLSDGEGAEWSAGPVFPAACRWQHTDRSSICGGPVFKAAELPLSVRCVASETAATSWFYRVSSARTEWFEM